MTESLDPEIMKTVAELANKLAWNKPELQVLQPQYIGQYPPLPLTLQTHLDLSNARGRLVLPDLRAFGNQSVGVFSDYGGESSGRYYTYSVLVCGFNLRGPLHEQMEAIRVRHGLGTKEIAFKDFRMGQIQRALPDYLQALDNLLPGFLFTLAIDKSIVTVFGTSEKATQDELAEMLRSEGLGERKPQVAEKLLRIVHLTAFLCGLLAHDNQKIFWMTDHDAICPSAHLHQRTLELFSRVLSVYTRRGCLFPLVGGGTPFEERSVEMLDLLSIADVVAGSLDQYLTRRVEVAASDEIRLKPGCELVLRWLGHDGVGLKKMTVMMRPGKRDDIESATLEFALEKPESNTIMIPVVV